MSASEALEALLAAARDVLDSFDPYISAWERKSPDIDAEFLYGQLASAVALFNEITKQDRTEP